MVGAALLSADSAGTTATTATRIAATAGSNRNMGRLSGEGCEGDYREAMEEEQQGKKVTWFYRYALFISISVISCPVSHVAPVLHL